MDVVSVLVGIIGAFGEVIGDLDFAPGTDLVVGQEIQNVLALIALQLDNLTHFRISDDGTIRRIGLLQRF